MRLDRFDLNLLVALSALIEERSVTRAAERLHLTQSAMSAALRRLREGFGDELFVSVGKRMVPTPLALDLAPKVEALIAGARELLAASDAFDPATSQRLFRIAASDYVAVIVIKPLIEELGRIAPGIRVQVLPPTPLIAEDLEQGRLDCVVSPEGFLARDEPSELLFEEAHVLLGWSGNPLFAREITLADFEAAGHVVVELSDTPTFVEAHVRAAGYQRRIEVVASSFTTVPWFLPGTNRVALVHERLARLFLDKLDVAMRPAPFDISPMREMVQYSRGRRSDDGLHWLIGQMHRHISPRGG